MPPKQLYTLDTRFWIFKSNYSTIDTINKYNEGEYTKINMNPTYSDSDTKYKRKESNIFCFPKDEKIKKGDFIFIFNDTKKGKINRGFVKHYRVSTDCSLNTKYKDVFKDNLLHKYFVKYDLEYDYEEIFNIVKFKDNFHDEMIVKTPIMFNKKYTQINLFNFI